MRAVLMVEAVAFVKVFVGPASTELSVCDE